MDKQWVITKVYETILAVALVAIILRAGTAINADAALHNAVQVTQSYLGLSKPVQGDADTLPEGDPGTLPAHTVYYTEQVRMHKTHVSVLADGDVKGHIKE